MTNSDQYADDFTQWEKELRESTLKTEEERRTALYMSGAHSEDCEYLAPSLLERLSTRALFLLSDLSNAAKRDIAKTDAADGRGVPTHQRPEDDGPTRA